MTVPAVLLALCLTVAPVDVERAHLEALITATAEAYGLDAAVVRCICQAESTWNPRAIGKAGERGLFQILPETGEFFAEKMGLPAQPDLFDPFTNVRLACWGMANGWEHWWYTYPQCQ